MESYVVLRVAPGRGRARTVRGAAALTGAAALVTTPTALRGAVGRLLDCIPVLLACALGALGLTMLVTTLTWLSLAATSLLGPALLRRSTALVTGTTPPAPGRTAVRSALATALVPLRSRASLLAAVLLGRLALHVVTAATRPSALARRALLCLGHVALAREPLGDLLGHLDRLAVATAHARERLRLESLHRCRARTAPLAALRVEAALAVLSSFAGVTGGAGPALPGVGA